ncbi:MAG: hypothetical protein LBC80_10770 [Treponema sp.]|jgi:hypothetical protein|nr:hypothetical protein [Treponema sp.]
MKKNNVFKCICLIIVFLFITSCYLTNVPIYPSASAFHNVIHSPFLAGNEEITGMATCGDFVVAVSYSGTIAWSDDHGITWDDTVTIIEGFSDGIRFNTVAWGEGYFFAGGDGGKAAFSRDGKLWHYGVIGPMSPKNILATAVGEMRGQTVFIAAGNDGRIAYALNSPTGPWVHVWFSPFGDLNNFGDDINALIYGKVRGNGLFVAAGDNGKYAVMNDFSEKLYGPTTAGTREDFRSAAYGNERFIAVGDGALMRISANPESYSWVTVRDHDFMLRPFDHIAFAPAINHFVVISSEDAVVGFSPDGELWSAITLTSRFVNGISAVVGTKERIILGGKDGMIVYSN